MRKDHIKILKIALIVIVISSLYIILISLWGFYSAIYPSHKILSTVTPNQWGLKYRNITFTTNDNVLIHGWFIPSAQSHAKTIILLHGYPADKGNILPSRLFLHSDFNLLFFDFRALGYSEGKYTSFGKYEILDLQAAIAYLQKHNINEVGVWGLSMGGAVALMDATENQQIKAIVAQSSYASLDTMLDTYYPYPLLRYPLSFLTRIWSKVFLGIAVNNVSPVEAVAQSKIPILIIHSKLDTQVPFEHALRLQAALRNNPNAEFLFINGSSHTQLSTVAEEKIKQFFEKHL